jgi:nucleoid-associated protein YgaU
MGQFDDVEGGGSSTAPETPQRTYTVKSGDSLSKIAKEVYGEASQWKKIYEANRDRIKNPDLIQPGWTLDIP